MAYAQIAWDLRWECMRFIHKRAAEKAGVFQYGLLWLIGIPVPILLLIFLLRGCR